MAAQLSSQKAQPHRGLVARILDQSQARGRLVVSLDELVQSSGLSPLAVRRQLEHLGERVARLPGRPATYLLVAPEHRARGTPPVASWLDAYLRYREQPYYLGLLSAAALHGSSHQAVQVTQVLTPRPTRPFYLGRLRMDFYVKSSLAQTPLSGLTGMPAPMAVSTPEATALDLVAFNKRIGGIRRAGEVIFGMKPKMTVAGLKKALAAEPQTAVKQRLGYVLDVLGMNQLAKVVERSLPAGLAPTLLQFEGKAAAPSTAPTHLVRRWNVVDNLGVESQLREVLPIACRTH